MLARDVIEPLTSVLPTADIALTPCWRVDFVWFCGDSRETPESVSVRPWLANISRNLGRACSSAARVSAWWAPNHTLASPFCTEICTSRGPRCSGERLREPD